MFILKNFKIEAKRTRSIVSKFIAKRSEHVYINELKNRSEANTLDSFKIYFEASEHVYIKEFKYRSEANNFVSSKIISKRSEHVYIKDFKYRSEAKQVNIKM
jgi:hypothetical protein